MTTVISRSWSWIDRASDCPRVSAGKHVVLADLRQAASDVAAKTLRDAGFDVSAKTVDVSSRASVHGLVELLPLSATSLASSMRPAYRRPKPRRRRS